MTYFLNNFFKKLLIVSIFFCFPVIIFAEGEGGRYSALQVLRDGKTQWARVAYFADPQYAEYSVSKIPPPAMLSFEESSLSRGLTQQEIALALEKFPSRIVEYNRLVNIYNENYLDWIARGDKETLWSFYKRAEATTYVKLELNPSLGLKGGDTATVVLKRASDDLGAVCKVIPEKNKPYHTIVFLTENQEVTKDVAGEVLIDFHDEYKKVKSYFNDLGINDKDIFSIKNSRDLENAVKDVSRMARDQKVRVVSVINGHGLCPTKGPAQVRIVSRVNVGGSLIEDKNYIRARGYFTTLGGLPKEVPSYTYVESCYSGGFVEEARIFLRSSGGLGRSVSVEASSVATQPTYGSITLKKFMDRLSVHIANAGSWSQLDDLGVAWRDAGISGQVGYTVDIGERSITSPPYGCEYKNPPKFQECSPEKAKIFKERIEKFSIDVTKIRKQINNISELADENISLRNIEI